MEILDVTPIYISYIVYNIIRINMNIIPTTYQLIEESQYRSIISLNYKYSSLLYQVFYIIIISNIIGLIPYGITITLELIVTLYLAFIILVTIIIISIISDNVLIIAIYIPQGLPFALLPVLLVLEILAYVIRIISLGLRLAMNILTGHILINLLLSFGSLSLLFIFIFIILDLLIAYLQAYIFIFIISLTLSDYLTHECK